MQDMAMFEFIDKGRIVAVVIVQALASGLPVVCTERTGGADLIRVGGLARLIRVVPTDDPPGLRRALTQALKDAIGGTGIAPITAGEREELGWNRYALRHLQFVDEMLQRMV
jgi:alpha-maltose-1-phosphate synthase